MIEKTDAWKPRKNQGKIKGKSRENRGKIKGKPRKDETP